MPNPIDDQQKDAVTLASLADASPEELDAASEIINKAKDRLAAADDKPNDPVVQGENEKIVAELQKRGDKLAAQVQALQGENKSRREQEEIAEDEARQDAEQANLDELGKKKAKVEEQRDLVNVCRGMMANVSTAKAADRQAAYAEAYRRISEGAVLVRMMPSDASRLIHLPAVTEEQLGAQVAWDMYYGAAVLLSKPQQDPAWDKADALLTRADFNVKQVSDLRKALDTATSGEGAELIPTGFSATLYEKLYIALRFASLFPRFPMPTNPFKWPVQTSFGTAYRMSEATADTDFFTSKVTPSTPGTSNKVFNADKLGCAVFASDEIQQDSIIPVLPFIGDEVVRALGFGIEDALLNGSTLLTDLDNADTIKLWTSTGEARNSWDGIRKAQAANGTSGVNGSTFTTANIRSARAQMGVYGLDPNQLAVTTGPVGISKLLGLAEVITIDKFGPSATIVTGQLANVDGMPVIPSGFVYENLNASGVYDGITTTKTIVVLVHRNGHFIGDRRAVQVEQDRMILSGQTAVVASWRGDAQKMAQAADDTENMIYNMA